MALTHYFAASTGADDWRDVLDGMLSGTGRAEQDSIDQRLVRPQEMLGFPAAKEVEDPNAVRMHCEGTSTLTGWMIALSKAGPSEPWLVDSIRAMETSAGYWPPKMLAQDEE